MTGEVIDQSSRWRMLLDALSIHKRLSVAEAAELLGVSAATVRRDFKELARQQLATRTHGGVVATTVAYDLPARYRIAPGDPRERIACEPASGHAKVSGTCHGTPTPPAAAGRSRTRSAPARP